MVINQLTCPYECKNDVLREYYEEYQELLKNFWIATLHHIPRGHNEEANRLAQIASRRREDQEILALSEDQVVDDWRNEIANYLKNPSQKVSRKLRYKALKFVVLDD